MKTFMVLWLILITNSAYAQINITADQVVKNKPPGRCAWCSLETLAKHHKYKQLYGISNKYAKGTSDWEMERVLVNAGMTYFSSYKNKDISLLNWAVAEDLGAIIGFKALPNSHAHAVLLTNITDTHVCVLDSNDGQYHWMTRERFLYFWDGYIVVPIDVPHCNNL